MPSLSPTALQALRGPILSILRKSDLKSVSVKQVRLALINTPADAMQGDVGSDVAGPRLLPRLGINVEDKAHKKAVDEMIKECYDTVSDENSGVKSSNGSTPALALPGMGGVRGSSSSSSWPGSTTGAPTSSASSTPAIKKRSRAQADEVDSDEEDADAETMTKIAKKAAKKPKAPRKKKSNLNPDGTEKEKRPPNPNNPFNKPVILSDDMSAVCGGREMPRYEITKKLWAYIKGKDLQDPANKRKILCDPTLVKIFGKSEVDSFEMARLISPHVTKKAD